MTFVVCHSSFVAQIDMFPLTIAQPYQTLLTALLGVWLVALVTAFAYGKYNAERTRHSVSWLLMTTSGLLVAAALIWWLAGAPPASRVVSPWLMLGMTAGFAGDLILAGHVPFLRGTLPGMIAFSITHLCYLTAFGQLARVLSLPGDPARWIWVSAYLALGVILWAVLINSPNASRVLNYGALGYSLLIGAMTGFAVSLAVREPTLWPLALGANLFLLSDILLGNQLFRKTNWRHSHDVVWVLYIFGQALIVFSSSVIQRLAQQLVGS